MLVTALRYHHRPSGVQSWEQGNCYAAARGAARSTHAVHDKDNSTLICGTFEETNEEWGNDAYQNSFSSNPHGAFSTPCSSCKLSRTVVWRYYPGRRSAHMASTKDNGYKGPLCSGPTSASGCSMVVLWSITYDFAMLHRDEEAVRS
jgi:hypothetical protein